MSQEWSQAMGSLGLRLCCSGKRVSNSEQPDDSEDAGRAIDRRGMPAAGALTTKKGGQHEHPRVWWSTDTLKQLNRLNSVRSDEEPQDTHQSLLRAMTELSEGHFFQGLHRSKSTHLSITNNKPCW